MTFLPLILIVIVFYFLLIRPQQKRAKEAREQQSNLKAGDKVMLTAGVLGEVTGFAEDNNVQVQIADGVIITVVRQAIGQVLPEHDETDEHDDEADEAAEGEESAETQEATEAAATGETKDPGVIVELGKKDSSN